MRMHACAVGIVLIAAGCDQRVACGAARCEVAELCLSPAHECVVVVPRSPCAVGSDCTVSGLRGCWEDRFAGDCIELPAACDGVATCSCLTDAISTAAGPTARCAGVDERGWVLVAL